jgi:predicted phage-related endonuclease
VSFIALPRSEAEWHALRRRFVGGSEVAALFGVQQKYQHSAYALWHIKGGHIADPGESPEEEDEERIQWGVALEAIIAAEAAKRWFWKIEKGAYAVDDTTPGLGATLDYVIAQHSEDDPRCIGPGALEVKNVDAFIHARSWSGDEPPLHIVLQLQHQLAASGFAWGAIAALVGGNRLRIWRYFPRPRIIAEIRKRVTEFWASIEAGRPPPTDGLASTAQALRSLYPELAAPEVEVADVALATDCAGFLVEQEFLRAAKTRLLGHKNAIIARAEGNARLFVPAVDDGPAYRVSIARNHRVSVREMDPIG